MQCFMREPENDRKIYEYCITVPRAFVHDCLNPGFLGKNSLFSPFFLRLLGIFYQTIDLIHNTRHLCACSMIDGIKAMSRGTSGGKQLIKFANRSNRGRVCLF